MKAVIYCRVSTKEQAETGYSLEAQTKACRKFAINNDYEVAKIFIERGESAKT
jgi:site-specific DNA recombinase